MEPDVPQRPVEDIPTFLAASIISLFFCGPFGLVALIFSILTIQAKKYKDPAGAEKLSDWARWFMYMAFAFGIVLGFFSFIGNYYAPPR